MSFGFRDCFGFRYSDFEFILASLEVLSWSPNPKSSQTVVTPKNRPAYTCKRFLRFVLSLCSFVPQCLCGYESIMQNKANILNAQMNISFSLTKYYEKQRLCSRSEKQTQSNPIYSEPVESTCSELACTEQGRSVEPIANQPPHFLKKLSKTPIFLIFCLSSSAFSVFRLLSSVFCVPSPYYLTGTVFLGGGPGKGSGEVRLRPSPAVP